MLQKTHPTTEPTPLDAQTPLLDPETVAFQTHNPVMVVRCGNRLRMSSQVVFACWASLCGSFRLVT